MNKTGEGVTVDNLIGEHISRFYKTVNEQTEERLHKFLFELIMSGDVFFLENIKSPIYTENDYPKNGRTIELNHYNLACYQPCRKVNELEMEIRKLKEEIFQLKLIEKKWSCECCRLSYDRGGCPDHGPALVGGEYS